ncbi:MAG: hypothetical protein ABSC32_17855 [Steroidobacteraceae bacterium]|jgi:hypothetical protein
MIEQRTKLAARSKADSEMHGIADNVPSRKSASESQLPVFQQEWWRSVVARTPGYRENTVVREKQVVGTLPYLLKSRLGVRVGAIPWSNLTGPIIADARLSEVDRIRVVDELVKGIPPHVSMRYMFDSDDPNASLYVSIFEKAHFAFEIERNFREPPDASDVFKRVVRRHKNPINQAMKHLDIVDVGPEFFTRFYASNLEWRGRALRADISIATDLLSEGLRRGQTRIRAARSKSVNGDGEYVYHAAVATAEDRTRVFGWMLSYHRPPHGCPLPNGCRGATRYLFLDAVAYAKRRGLVFDVNGAPTSAHMENFVEIIGVTKQVDRFVMVRRNFINSAYVGGKRLFLAAWSPMYKQVHTMGGQHQKESRNLASK